MMSKHKNQAQRAPESVRRGLVAVMVLVTLVVLLGVAALAVDVGMMYRARGDAQTVADAAAMAAAWELLDQDRLSGGSDMSQEFLAARNVAASLAAENYILRHAPHLDLTSDVRFGYLHDSTDPSGVIQYGNPANANSVDVTVRRDGNVNGPIDLYFAGVFGKMSTTVSARAVATFKDGVTGFTAPTDGTGNSLLPLALHVDVWNNLLSGALTHGDSYAYDLVSGSVSAGADTIHEINMYPSTGGADQLPSGNFGTVDIGTGANSTSVLERQILDGVNADDLSHHGGDLALDQNGYLQLTGDTGLSAGIKDELEAVIGMARTIPLFDTVVNPGNNADFRIVGFAGIRIMAVKLTGAATKKHVLIQPAFVVDPWATTDPGAGPSSFVYQPVVLSR